MNEVINAVLEIVLGQIPEAIYFGMFLLVGKNIKEKRLLFIGIMIFEYILLKQFIHFNVWFQLIYTFMSFVVLKILYKEKAQITDIFLFMIASLILILFSFITNFTAILTYKNYFISSIINRSVILIFIFLFKKVIRNKYREFCSLWNRHNHKNKIRSLTLRNISIITFNFMFWLINIGMIYALYYNSFMK